MAIKRKLIECECGELFTEVENNQLEGNISLGPWLLKTSRKRKSKTPEQSDILLASFDRSVFCANCKNELMRENRQYELTPSIKQDEPVTSYSTREFLYAK